MRFSILFLFTAIFFMGMLCLQSAYPAAIEVAGNFNFSTQGFSNALKNASFEAWPSTDGSAPCGWLDRGSSRVQYTKEETDRIHGNYALGMTGIGTKRVINLTEQTVTNSKYFAGRTVTFSCWVKTGGANVKAKLFDGETISYSQPHSGSGKWEFLVVTAKLSDTAQNLTCYIYQPTADQRGEKIIVDCAMLVEGATPIGFNLHPSDTMRDALTPVHITDKGVGLGTAAPDSKLHINGGNLKISNATPTLILQRAESGIQSYIFTSTLNTLSLSTKTDRGTGIDIDQNGNVGIGTASPKARLDVNGPIFQRGAQLHADYVFEPEYKLESIEEHSAYMRENKHLKAVPAAMKTLEGEEVVEIGAHRRGILEELEKAHCYIEELNHEIKLLKARIAELEKNR